MKTSKKISEHIKSIADTYNALYEGKMKERFNKDEKKDKSRYKSTPKKKSDGIFRIRVWNP